MSASDLNAALAPTITLNEIPDDWRNPGVNLEVRPNYSNQGLNTLPSKTLIIGLGYTPSAYANKPVAITRPGQANAMFGAGSPLAAAVENFIAANPYNAVFAAEAVTNLASAGAIATATGKFAFTAPATVSGEFYLSIDGITVPLGVSSGDSVTLMASELVAAVNAVADLPVTAALDGATVGGILVLGKTPGLNGNDIDFRVINTALQPVPTGLAYTLTPMTGGVGTSDIQPILNNISNQWFTDIVLTMTDPVNMAAFATEMAARYNAMKKLDCHGWVVIKGTYSALMTDVPMLQNSPYITALGVANCPSAPWKIVGALAGVCVYALAQDPSRQLRSLPLPGVVPPDDIDCFEAEEQDQLLRNGWSTFDSVNGQVVLDRIITAYLTTTLGAPDTSWLDVMTVKTCTAIRYDWRQYALLNWPRAKLAPDGSTAEIYDTSGVVVTPLRAHNAWASRCTLYAQAAWIVNEEATSAASVFEIDPNNDNRMETLLQIEIIGNLMRLDGALEFAA